MANLNVDFDYLKGRVGKHVGWGSSSAWTSDQTTEIEEIVNDGYRNWLGAPYAPGRIHKWSFLEPRKQLTLTAPYSTGTVGISSGVVTLSGGDFDANAPWADQGQIVVSGGTYTVKWRGTDANGTDSDTKLTLDDLTVNLAAGTGYELQRVTYDLDSDFGGFGDGPIINESDSLPGVKTIERVSESILRRQRDYYNYSSYPRMAAHYYKTVADNNSDAYQQQVIEFWPPADRQYIVSYHYIVNPNELSASNTRPLGNQRYHESLTCAVLAEAEQRIFDGTLQVYTRKYQTELAAAVRYDQEVAAPRNTGKMRNTADRNQWNHIFENYERPTAPGTIYTA